MARQPHFTRRCHCCDCEAAWLDWAEQVRDADALAARDPETREQLRRDFDAWLATNPEPA